MALGRGGRLRHRASFDAIITIGAVLALLAFGSTLKRWRLRHVVTSMLLLIVLGVFGVLLHRSLKHAGYRLGPVLQQLEEQGPT